MHFVKPNLIPPITTGMWMLLEFMLFQLMPSQYPAPSSIAGSCRT